MLTVMVSSIPTATGTTPASLSPRLAGRIANPRRSGRSVVPAFNIIDRLARDFSSLSMRASTRVITRAKGANGRDECLAIKSELANAVANGTFVVDCFAAAAVEASLDTTTAKRGGLIGEMLQPGALRSRVLDESSFASPVGQIVGPIESEMGTHLVLVEERIGDIAADISTKVVPEPWVVDGQGGRVRSVVRTWRVATRAGGFGEAEVTLTVFSLAVGMSFIALASALMS